MSSTSLSFTGERYLPEIDGDIWAEHWHRYRFAASLCVGQRVLDVSSGEGYGTAHLASVAHEVIGLDVSASAVAHARERYARPNLRFENGSVTNAPFADASFDVVTSFETIEHLIEQEAMIAELARVLKPDGLLILSSPDRAEYSEKRGYHNEYHVKELSHGELLALLKPHFPAVRCAGQRIVVQSALWPVATDTSKTLTPTALVLLREGDRAPLPEPMYWIVLARKTLALDLPVIEATALTDPKERMLHAFTLAEQKRAQLEGHLAEHQTQLNRLERETQSIALDRQRLEQHLIERTQLLEARDQSLSHAQTELSRRAELVAERDRLLVEHQSQLTQSARRAQSLESLLEARDSLLRDTNERAAQLESHLAVREQLLVERDAHIAKGLQHVEHLEALLNTHRERIAILDADALVRQAQADSLARELHAEVGKHQATYAREVAAHDETRRVQGELDAMTVQRNALTQRLAYRESFGGWLRWPAARLKTALRRDDIS